MERVHQTHEHWMRNKNMNTTQGLKEQTKTSHNKKPEGSEPVGDVMVGIHLVFKASALASVTTPMSEAVCE